MKKELLIASITVLLLVSPAYAVRGENNKSDNATTNPGASVSEEKKVQQQELVLPVDPIEVVITPVISTTPTPTEKDELRELVVLPEDKKSVKSILEITATPSPSQMTCDPESEWKNHGAYVSCVAKTHPGGQVVSAAAKSDIGKQLKDATPTATPTVTTSPTPPLTSPVVAAQFDFAPWKYFKNAIARFIHNVPFINVFAQS